MGLQEGMGINAITQLQRQSLNQSFLGQAGMQNMSNLAIHIPQQPLDLYPTKAHRKWAKKEGQVISFKEALKREIELWHGDVLEV